MTGPIMIRFGSFPFPDHKIRGDRGLEPSSPEVSPTRLHRAPRILVVREVSSSR